MRSLSKTAFSSISLTKGRIFCSANWRMLSRKRSSSSVRVVKGAGAEACNAASGMGTPLTGGWQTGNFSTLVRDVGWLGGRSLGALVDQLQRVGLQDAFDLTLGVHRPGAGTVELDIRLPVFQSLAWLAQLFVGQGKIVVHVGVSRSQLQSGLVGLNRFFDAAGFVEDIAQIEVSECVSRVGFDGLAVVAFGEYKILAVVVEGAQIDVSRGMRGFDIEHLVIGGDGLALSVGVFFQRDATGEPGGDFGLPRARLMSGNRRAGHDALALGEIHKKLAGDGFEQF